MSYSLNYTNSKLVRRISELTEYSNLPHNENVAEGVNHSLEAVLSQELWSTIDVCEQYGFSRQNLYNIRQRYEVPGVLYFGRNAMFIVEFAKPWFDEYAARNGGK